MPTFFFIDFPTGAVWGNQGSSTCNLEKLEFGVNQRGAFFIKTNNFIGVS